MTNTNKKWDGPDLLHVWMLWLDELSLQRIIPAIGRNRKAIETIIWKIPTNYDNRGAILLSYLTSRSIILNREGRKWTAREVGVLIAWRDNKNPSKGIKRLTIDEISILLGKTVGSVNQQLKRMERSGGFGL